MEVIIEPAQGIKCERCWRLVDVVCNLGICERCVGVGQEDGWLRPIAQTLEDWKDPEKRGKFERIA